MRHCKVCNLLFCTVDAWEKFRAQREEDLRGAPETRPDGAPVHANYGGKPSPPAEGGGQPDGQPINGAGFPPPESSIEVYFHGVRIPPHMAAWPPHVVAGAVVPALQSDLAMAREHGERYSLRLAGVLSVAEGHSDRAEIEDEGTADFIRACPTVKAVLQLREDLDELEDLWERESRRPAVGGPVEVVRGIVATHIGMASMCWSPRPSTEVFDSEEAGRVVEGLIQALQLPGAVLESIDGDTKPAGPEFRVDPLESGGTGDAAMQAAVRIVATLEKSRLVEVDHHRTRNSLQDGIAAEIRQTLATTFAATIADREAMAKDLETVQTRNDELERAAENSGPAPAPVDWPAAVRALEEKLVEQQRQWAAAAAELRNAGISVGDSWDEIRGGIELLAARAPLTHSRTLEQVVDFAVDQILDVAGPGAFASHRRTIAAHVRGAVEAGRGIETVYHQFQPYKLEGADVDALRQLLVITWDGNLVSKDARDRFVAAGLAVRTSEGGNIITPAGVNALGSAGELPRLDSIAGWRKAADIKAIEQKAGEVDNLQGHLRERDRKFHELEEKMREVRRGEKILAEALRP